MVDLLFISSGFAVGVVFAAWRLKGKLSVKEAVAVVIQGGGGPGSTDD